MPALWVRCGLQANSLRWHHYCATCGSRLVADAVCHVRTCWTTSQCCPRCRRFFLVRRPVLIIFPGRANRRDCLVYFGQLPCRPGKSDSLCISVAIWTAPVRRTCVVSIAHPEKIAVRSTARQKHQNSGKPPKTPDSKMGRGNFVVFRRASVRL